MTTEQTAEQATAVGRELAGPCTVVFLASFCIMVMELVAGRLIARYLGSSLYTWTAIIGVVMAGITAGNYLGGRIADRRSSGAAVALLFILSGALCLCTIVSNGIFGRWLTAADLSWPLRVFLHVAGVFMLPAAALGTITPLIAKRALDRGVATGRTVGNIYAWSVGGSIAGTFAAGYVLIATMSTTAIITAMSLILMALGLLFMSGGKQPRPALSQTAMIPAPAYLRSLWAPCVTVFVTNFCIMAMELDAGRIISRHLGSSLYTWTAVIGVILAGITAGNYLGGRIADKTSTRRTVTLLLLLCSMAFILTIISGNLVADWLLLWQLSWPLRVMLHVALVFFMPSLLLGMVSPVIAKRALARGLATGQTVGVIYAAGSLGCIAGTFAAGYALISLLGTMPLLLCLACLLAALALAYSLRRPAPCIWAALLVLAVALTAAPMESMSSLGTMLALRTQAESNVLYENESQYNYIAVKRVSEIPDVRIFLQDKLVHSRINMFDVSDLRYSYEPIYAAVTHRFSKGKKQLATLTIGGGGYAFPRYIEKVWPGSRIDVVEIDPAVTEAAMQAFGLSRDTTIRTYSLDGRNYIDDVLQNRRGGTDAPRYDFIYEDAINDYSVPFQLTTREFNDKIAAVLNAGGIYMVNLIDMLDSGLFLGAIVNTLKLSFPHVYVLSEKNFPSDERCTFVIVAAKHALDLRDIGREYRADLDLWQLSDSDIAALKRKAEDLVLTDNFAPIENLLAPVVKKNVAFAMQLKQEVLVRRIAERMQNEAWQGNVSGALEKIDELLPHDPAMSVRAYNVVGGILNEQGNHQAAADVFRKGLSYNLDHKTGLNMATLHYNLALTLRKLHAFAEAGRQVQYAEYGFRKMLERDPSSFEAHMHLGVIARETGNLQPAIAHFQRAVGAQPQHPLGHLYLVETLLHAGKQQEAVMAGRRAISVLNRTGQQPAAQKIAGLFRNKSD